MMWIVTLKGETVTLLCFYFQGLGGSLSGRTSHTQQMQDTPSEDLLYTKHKHKGFAENAVRPYFPE